MSEDLEPITPDEAIEMYITEKQSEYAEATLRSHRSRLGYFEDWCEIENVGNLNSLSGRDLHQYRLWRRDDGDLGRVAEKTQMDTIRVFIRFCESVDAVEQDLSTKVVSPSLSKGDNARDVMVDSDTAERILDHLRTYEFASGRHVCIRLMWRAALRRGSVRALDVGDYISDEQSLQVKHRAATGTPIKNQAEGERFIALNEQTCKVLDAWLDERRPDVTDEAGRRPLLATKQGRTHLTTIQSYVYSVTRPCFYSSECPHGRDIETCDAAANKSQAFGCPSSVSPHAVRRGSITHWLEEDLPKAFVSDRANVSPDIIDEHYDRRSERDKMEQRRGFLDNM